MKRSSAVVGLEENGRVIGRRAATHVRRSSFVFLFVRVGERLESGFFLSAYPLPTWSFLVSLVFLSFDSVLGSSALHAAAVVVYRPLIGRDAERGRRRRRVENRVSSAPSQRASDIVSILALSPGIHQPVAGSSSFRTFFFSFLRFCRFPVSSVFQSTRLPRPPPDGGLAETR